MSGINQPMKTIFRRGMSLVYAVSLCVSVLRCRGKNSRIYRKTLMLMKSRHKYERTTNDENIKQKNRT